jgi:hypothetical protein
VTLDSFLKISLKFLFLVPFVANLNHEGHRVRFLIVGGSFCLFRSIEKGN